MKTKHFLGLALIGLGVFALSVVMKSYHLAGTHTVLWIADILIVVGLVGLGIKVMRNSNNSWLNH